MTAVVTVEAAAIALLAVLVFGLLRSQAQMLDLLRDPGPAAPLPVATGGEAPAVLGVTPEGEPVTADVSAAAGPVLLAFLTGGCRECAGWWNVLRSDQRRLLATGVAVVTPSPSTEPAAAIRRAAPADVPVIMSSDVWDAYGVRQASTFVLVAGGRVRAAGRASSWDDLATIVGLGLSGPLSGDSGR